MIEFETKEVVNNTLQVLFETDKILNSPEKWTQGHPAECEFGETVDVDSPEACKFCLTGAYVLARNKVMGDEFNGITNLALLTIRKTLKEMGKGDSLTGYNDNPDTTYYDIKNLLNHSIRNVRIWSSKIMKVEISKDEIDGYDLLEDLKRSLTTQYKQIKIIRESLEHNGSTYDQLASVMVRIDKDVRKINQQFYNASWHWS